MITVKSTKIVFVDVDDTLVMWSKSDPCYSPHLPHINMIKQFKNRGHTVIVWSLGGHEWAEHVVTELGLVEYVDVVCSKPDWYIDDKNSSDFMQEHKRIYLK